MFVCGKMPEFMSKNPFERVSDDYNEMKLNLTQQRKLKCVCCEM